MHRAEAKQREEGIMNLLIASLIMINLVLGITVVIFGYLLYRSEKSFKALMEIKELLADELEKHLKA